MHVLSKELIAIARFAQELGGIAAEEVAFDVHAESYHVCFKVHATCMWVGVIPAIYEAT